MGQRGQLSSRTHMSVKSKASPRLHGMHVKQVHHFNQTVAPLQAQQCFLQCTNMLTDPKEGCSIWERRGLLANLEQK